MKRICITLLLMFAMMNTAAGAAGSHTGMEISDVELVEISKQFVLADTCCDEEQASQTTQTPCKSECNAVLPTFKVRLHNATVEHAASSRAPPRSTLNHSEHRPPII